MADDAGHGRRLPVDGGDHRRQKGFVPRVVVVVDDHQVAARGLQSGIGRRPPTFGLGVMDEPDTTAHHIGYLRQKLLERRRIAAVVDDDDFPIVEMLLLHAEKTAGEEQQAILGADDDGNARHELA
jgi:hypothetical protein